MLDWRTTLLRIFLPIVALLALPSLGIGALIWWRTGKTWDYRERWAGTWVLAIIGLVVYIAITWVAHPLPSLLHALFVERQESVLVAGLQTVGKLWLLHLCFAPACALVLEWLHPLTRRVRWLSRYRVPRRGILPLAIPLFCLACCLLSFQSEPGHEFLSPFHG